MNPERILDKLLTKVSKFSIPPPNKDFANFSTSMISLKVYLEELKTEHNLDLTQEAAEKLIAHIVHHSMPSIILDEYRNLLNKSFPSLSEFFDKASTIVTKLQDKTESQGKTKPLQNETSSIVSTIPENTINAVGAQKSKGFNSKGSSRNPCLFCGSLQHSASRCNLFVTVDSHK